MRQGGFTLRINIDPLMRQLSVNKNELVTVVYVSRQSGLAYDTVRRIKHSRRFDVRTIEKLLAFFRDEGLDVSAGDLFEEVNGAQSN